VDGDEDESCPPVIPAGPKGGGVEGCSEGDRRAEAVGVMGMKAIR